jgi:uncharacterized protein
MNKKPVSKELIELVRKEFVLPWYGIHGIPHWVRVRDNGLRLAKVTHANADVVELFAFLHDSKRLSDGKDLEHGRRAAEFIRTLGNSLVTLADQDFKCLVFACERHSDGLIEADVTIQTCWDADRLDLGRVGIKPDAHYLCTLAAQEQTMIEWAFLRSRQTKQSTKA